MADEHLAQPARLVGRERPLARLRRLVADPPPGALILISGEAGIGKTALVNQIVAERLAAGGRALRGAGDERATARFSLWRRPMYDLGVALPHADPSVGAADQIEELAATIGDSLAPGRWGTLVLEDVHWADAASIEVLQLVVDRLIARPVAIVATARPGEPRAKALAPLQRRSQSIVLTGLTSAEIERIAVDLAGEALAPGIANALHRRTGGNPLYVRELVATASTRLSLTTEGLLSETLGSVGPTTANFLGILAIAGPAAPLASCAHALSTSLDEIELHQRRALDADILTRRTDGVWFRHDLLADAAANRFDAATRRDVHRALGDFWTAFPNFDDDGLERARHVLAAVSIPSVEDSEILLDTAAVLRRRRRAGDAADLLKRALDAWATAGSPLMWMALGEAHWDLSERQAALRCFDRAAETVDRSDVEAVTAIEVARHRNHNPFVPDPVARERLSELGEQLPATDSALRAALLGRRAMLALQPPARPEAASAFADQALAMARRLGDPDALLTALCDRGFVVGSANDVRRRRDIADEVLELARLSGRPDRAVSGHEWRFDDCLTQGDLTAAVRYLDEFEALASVSPSSYWLYTSSVRRAMVQIVQGDPDGARETIIASAHASSGLIDRFELIGLELGIRAPIMILFGLPDRRVAELQAQMVEIFDQIPSAFMQVRLAVGDLLIGDRRAAQRLATRWLSEPTRAFEAPDPIGTLALMAFLASELHITERAPAIAARLHEFTGLLSGAIPLPVDLLVARLDTMTDKAIDAIDHAQRALDLVRSMPSPVLEAHCLSALADAQLAAGNNAAAAAATAAAVGTAERNGLVLAPPWSRRATTTDALKPNPADIGSRSTRTARLERDGHLWRIQSGPESAALVHVTGLEQLARLLAVPGVDVAAADLQGVAQPPNADLGAALDARAKREYRRRISQIQGEIDEAERWADPERAETHRRELDTVIAELRRAVGLGGRDRPQGSGSERARINVTRNIRRAINAIDNVAPQLGAHLTISVRTGHHCSYSPEPASRIHWEIDLRK